MRWAAEPLFRLRARFRKHFERLGKGSVELSMTTLKGLCDALCYTFTMMLHSDTAFCLTNAIYLDLSCLLLLDPCGDLKARASLLLDLSQSRPRHDFREGQFPCLSVDVEYRQLGDDDRDTSRTRQREGTLVDDLGFAVFVGVVGNDDDLYRAGR